MRGFADCLIAAGQITTDQNVIMSVLNDLGLEYDPVVVHFTSREDYVSLSEAQYILMSQEQRLARLHSAVSLDLSNATANLAYGNNQCNQCGGCRNNRVDRGRNSVTDSSWYFDSRATNHMTSNVDNLNLRQEYKGSNKLAIGNSYELPTKHAFMSSHSPTKWCS
ncbi:hypothetical protein ACOSQ3_027023 [Xanthoceras sorbifolium]